MTATRPVHRPITRSTASISIRVKPVICLRSGPKPHRIGLFIDGNSKIPRADIGVIAIPAGGAVRPEAEYINFAM